jgi:hypothetical protein
MIRRRLWFALLPALFLAILPVAASAQTGTIIDWGPDSYAWETNFNRTTYISNSGSTLFAVGKVNAFLGPLAGFDPLAPGVEYTYYLENFVSQGTTITPGPTSSIYTTVYLNQGGGRLAFYQDFTPDASFGTNPPNATAPASFIDGNLFLVSTNIQQITINVVRQNSNGFILSGSLDTGDPTPAGPWFIGGLALPLVSSGDRPCPIRLTGGYLERPGTFPTGYTAWYDGKVDINCPVSTIGSTWGRIKTQYR